MKNLKQARTGNAWQKLFIKLTAAFACSTLMTGLCFALPNAEGIQVYQKDVHLLPEHKQRLDDDIYRYRTADNLWDALREEFTLPHYENNPIVQEKIAWFMNNQDYLLRSALRAAPYLFYISQQVKKRHLPAELVLLPIVESGYNPFSTSPVGATGIWQLMPDTATGLGIKQDWWFDGRRDVISSTRAALNYLGYLQSFFEGNWLLAIAAYNTGEGNVLSAIKRNIREGRDTDFWSLPVAQQTRDYVPSVLALAVILSHPERYPVYFPPVRNAPYLAQIDVGRQINIKYAAQLAGMSFKRMTQLNPGFTRPQTSTRGPYKLVVPIENVEQFTENLARSPLTPQIDWIHYRVKAGDTLASISKKFGIGTDSIRRLNHLTKNTLKVKYGTNLLLPTNDGNDVGSETPSPAEEQPIRFAAATKPVKKRDDIYTIANQFKRVEEPIMPVPVSSSGSYALQPGDTIYMVRSKDTLETIAKRFHVSTQSLRTANRIKQSAVKPGIQIIVPTHLASLSAPNENTSKPKKIQPGDTIYMVRHGDTVEKIARKFNASAAAIRLVNFVDNSSLIPGDKIIIPTHLRG